MKQWVWFIGVACLSIGVTSAIAAAVMIAAERRSENRKGNRRAIRRTLELAALGGSVR